MFGGDGVEVMEEMNTHMLRPFVVSDVYVALAQMHLMKSLGPDGFLACFYQRAWPTVRGEVCKAVLDFLNDGHFDNAINATHIVLIPKVKNPSSATKFRPISLCNVIYKLVSKVIANKMKKVLLLYLPTKVIS